MRDAQLPASHQLQADVAAVGGERAFPTVAARYVRAHGPLKAKWRWCLIRFIYNKRTPSTSAAISTRLTASHPNSEVKLVRAGVVLRWGTTREGPVLRFLFCFAQAFFLLRKIGFILHLPWPFLSFLVTQPCRLAREDNESDLMVPERQSKLVRQNVSKAESNSCDCSSPTDLKSAPRTVQDHADLSSNPAHRAQDPGRGRDWSAGLHCKLCTQVRI